MLLYFKIILTMIIAHASIALAARSETSPGILFGQFTPTYPSSPTASPALPKTLLAKGAEATFIKGNVLLGARAWYGSSHSTDNVTGSHYSIGALTVMMGTGADFDNMGFYLGTGLGIGTMSYAVINTTTPLSLDASFIDVEPTASIGFNLTSDFKLSFGGAYTYGYVHEVNQDAPTAAQLQTPTDTVKVGGVLLFAKFSAIVN